MTDDDRDGSGQFTQQYPDDAFLQAVRAHEPGGTSEIAAAVGCTTQNADYRLRQLEAAGAVTSKKIGGTLVWTTHHDEGDGDTTGDRPTERAIGRNTPPDPTQSSGRETDRRRQAARAFTRRVVDRLGDSVREAYLFGSVALEDATESSDVDVLVVVDADADFASVDDRLLDIAYTTGMEYDVPIEVHSIRGDDFDARRDRGEPLVRRVLRDGVAIA